MTDREAAHQHANFLLKHGADAWDDKNLAAAYLELEAALAAERQRSQASDDRRMKLAHEIDDLRKQLVAERTAREQQEPVAWHCTQRDYTDEYVSVYWDDSMGDCPPEGKGWTPLYAAPQDTKAIHAAALEEAARVCEKYEASAKTDDGWIYLATSIRSLK